MGRKRRGVLFAGVSFCLGVLIGLGVIALKIYIARSLIGMLGEEAARACTNCSVKADSVKITFLPVRAIAKGRVVFAEWMRGFGNLLIIDHGDAYLSIYGNNEALLKQVGQAVQGGDTVATVGNTGGNPESGLYFEIRRQGQPIDPLSWATLK